MARIYGKIESLKSLKYELENNGISRFNSVKEIKDFLSNYNSEKLTVLNNESDKLEKEYSETCSNLKRRIQNKTEIINLETEKIDNRISDLLRKVNSINTKDVNFLKKIISSLKLYSLRKEANYLIKNKNDLISAAVKEITRNIKNDEIFISEYDTKKQNLIEKRAKSKIDRLEYTRNVIENSRNLIAGAIGEHLVVKEIKKLSDSYVLINDFNLNFSPPIFYKKHNQKIYSVQVDHLLISKAGIFIIETKNWSKSSVNTINLRSPIKQIERSNYALYIYISENITLNEHHWGEQQIPIRNLIVMINNKPKGKFKYVKIKLINELNDYINYFEPVLTENQIETITNKLI
ncbi:nuclease-related domain-containing protein [Polaribacter sp. R77954]|uniref:nuclease-related domain-containing protein n=1 Tax=Polaribacter sp. R77954 TaxID=3093870 RepID=UPI0037C95D00